MALIRCPECNKKVSDQAPACPSCGVPIHRESKLIVASPVQTFAINPKIKMAWNGATVATIKKGERVDMVVDADGEASYSAGFRSTSLQVQAGVVTKVQLMWDRVSGKLIAQVVDSIGSGHSNL